MKKITKYGMLLIMLTYTLAVVSEDLIVTYNGGVLNIPLKPNTNVEVLVANGDVTAETDDTALELCTKLFNASLCSGTGGGSAPTINSFTANPTSVTSGGSSTLTWNLSNNADTCTKSGSWSGTLSGSNVTDGSHNETVTNITSNSTYRLECTNTNGTSALLSASVTIVTSANCTSQPPILSGNEDLTILANNTPNAGVYDGTFKDFQNVTPGVDWPGNFGDSISLSLTKNKYIAASFITNGLAQNGRFQLSTPGNLQGPSSSTTIVISECPGDFTTHLSQAKCRRIVGPSGSFKWSTDATSSSAVYCKLDNNTQYFLNIVHSTGPTNSTPENNFSVTACTGSTHCGILATMIQE